MKDEELFYIKDKQLKDSSVKADYIKYALIDNEGANVGISLLVCTMVPVLTWSVLEKNGTVVERIKGVE